VLGSIALALGLALLVPSVASAQVPPGTLPPEVEAALAEALGQLPSPLVPAVDGVGEASASPQGASSSVVDIDGVVTVGKSESSKTGGSKVTVLNVAGTDVLVKDGDASGGTYSGEAAPAGDAIDQVNEALCPGGPPSSTDAPRACVVVLYSEANETQTPVSENTFVKNEFVANGAEFRALSIHSPAGPESATVGYTTANSLALKTTVKSTGATSHRLCTDIATSFLVAGGGQLAALFLVNPGGPLNGVAISGPTPITQTC
jgi:hypothetical protein